MKKFLSLASIITIMAIAVFATGCNFSASVSPGKVSVEKPSDMSFNNVLIQKTAGKELKEFVAFIDEYLAKIEAGEDEYVYNTLLHSAFHDQYTLEEISDMHKTIRSWGKYESYDLDKAEISINKDSMSKEYNIVMPVKFEKATKKFTLKLVSENNVLKVVSFDFKMM